MPRPKGSKNKKTAATNTMEINISIESLCRINDLKPGAPLKVGQKLRGSK